MGLGSSSAQRRESAMDRLVASSIAEGGPLHPPARACLEEVFDEYDAEGNGELSPEQLTEVLKEYGRSGGRACTAFEASLRAPELDPQTPQRVCTCGVPWSSGSASAAETQLKLKQATLEELGNYESASRTFGLLANDAASYEPQCRMMLDRDSSGRVEKEGFAKYFVEMLRPFQDFEEERRRSSAMKRGPADAADVSGALREKTLSPRLTPSSQADVSGALQEKKLSPRLTPSSQHRGSLDGAQILPVASRLRNSVGEPPRSASAVTTPLAGSTAGSAVAAPMAGSTADLPMAVKAGSSPTSPTSPPVVVFQRGPSGVVRIEGAPTSPPTSLNSGQARQAPTDDMYIVKATDSMAHGFAGRFVRVGGYNGLPKYRNENGAIIFFDRLWKMSLKDDVNCYSYAVKTTATSVPCCTWEAPPFDGSRKGPAVQRA